MPATSINASDLSDLGISLHSEADTAASDEAHLADVSSNDPFMAELLASMEQATPSAEDLAKALREPVSDDVDEPATEAATITDPLAKPGDAARREAAETTEQPLTPADGVTTSPGSNDEATAPSTLIADSYVVDIGDGQTTTIDEARAKQLLALDGWAQNLRNTPGLTEALSAVEDGRAIPVPADQYEQFQAWLAGGKAPATTATSTAPVAPVAAQLPPLDEYADDTTKALYAHVAAQQAELASIRQSQIDTQTQYQSQQMQAHLDARAATFSTVFEQAAAEMGLSAAETNAALAHASNTRLIQSVNDELATRHPITGQPTGESDPAAVARTTFERAVYQLPALRDRVIDSQVQSRLDAERASITNINAKKNRASSLSTSPTAATTQDRDARNMTPQQREAAIAAELRAAMSA